MTDTNDLTNYERRLRDSRRAEEKHRRCNAEIERLRAEVERLQTAITDAAQRLHDTKDWPANFAADRVQDVVKELVMAAVPDAFKDDSAVSPTPTEGS